MQLNESIVDGSYPGLVLFERNPCDPVASPRKPFNINGLLVKAHFMTLNESIVKVAALEWFGELGYAIGHGPHIAPGEPAAERASFGDVVLVGRLQVHGFVRSG